MNYFLKLLFSIFVFSIALSAVGQQIPGRPVPPRLVNDFTNTLTPDQIQSIENRLVSFSDSTSTQIAVVIVESTGDYDVSEYAFKIGREWGVGSKEFNNGVVLLIAKKDRKLNIATGYGVEGALPDITASHIIQDIIVPQFKGNDYYRGIDEGTDAIIKAVKGEYSTPRTKSKKPGKFPVILIIIVLLILFSSGGGKKGGGFMSRRGYRGLGGPIFWGSMLGGGSGGGFGGGGSSGGGFGGFGGGSFGGGGASGSW